METSYEAIAAVDTESETYRIYLLGQWKGRNQDSRFGFYKILLSHTL